MNPFQLGGIILLLIIGGAVAYYASQSDAPELPAPIVKSEPVVAPPPAVAVVDKPAEKPPGVAENAAKATEATGKATGDALRQAGDATEDAAKQAGDAIRKAGESAEAAAEDAAKQAGDALRQAGDAAAEVAKEAEAAAEDAAKDAGDALQKAGDEIEKAAEEAVDAADKAAEKAGKAARDALDDAKRLLSPSPKEDKGAATPDAAPDAAPNEKSASAPVEPVADPPKAAAEGASPEPQKQLAALPRPEPPAPPASPPVIDVAEVDGAGDMTLAGTAAPGARVRLVTGDGEVIGEAIAGDDGSFVILPTASLQDGDSALRLETDGAAGVVAGKETLVVSRNGAGPPLVVLQGDDAAKPSRVLQQPPAAKPEALAKVETRPEAEPKAAAEPVRARDESLSVGAVDYDAKGRIAVQGKAAPGADVTVDVDGKKVADAKADAKGNWSAAAGPGAVKDGAADRVGATTRGAGDRPLRVSVPFAPAGLIRDFPKGRLVVVQPGNSLWRIARRAYGEGVRYTVIYAANRSQIDNPDMIHPGQILHAPRAN